MIEIATLKTYDAVNHKAGLQLAGSLTTYLDDIPVSVAVPASAMIAGNRVILAIPGGNPRDAVVIATWPQGSAGGGTFLSLTDTPSSYSGQREKSVRVNYAQDALEFAFSMYPDQKWVNEIFVVDPEDPASLWTVEKSAGAAIVGKYLGRLDFSTGATANNYLRMYADAVPGGAGYGGNVFIVITQWGGTTRTNSSAYIGVWKHSVTKRPPLTHQHYGWKVIDGSIYATVADGTTENAEDTGVDYVTDWNAHTLAVVQNASGNFEFYIDGVLKTTLTTNKPTFTAGVAYVDIVTADNVDKRIMFKAVNFKLMA